MTSAIFATAGALLPALISSRYAGPEMRDEIVLSHAAVADLADSRHTIGRFETP
jgi:hypothetical protein